MGHESVGIMTKILPPRMEPKTIAPPRSVAPGGAKRRTTDPVGVGYRRQSEIPAGTLPLGMRPFTSATAPLPPFSSDLMSGQPSSMKS